MQIITRKQIIQNYEWFTNLPLPDEGVDQVAIAIKLVLDYVVECFQQEEDEVMVVRGGEEEPWRAECLQEVQ